MTGAPPAILVVAGHDPSGGAGVDADAEAGRRFGVVVEAVVTAWTRQDGRRVEAVGARLPEEWAAEVRALAPRRFGVWKSGLLPGAAHVRALARLLAEARAEDPPFPATSAGGAGPEGRLPRGGWGLGMGEPRLVVDPVLAASGGERFLDEAGLRVLREELLPLGPILTPNVPEAARLVGLDEGELVRSLEARRWAAASLLERGAAAVVLKGGHGEGAEVVDLVCAAGEAPVELRRARVAGAGIHGSGCRHASALACGLARGEGLVAAAEAAGRWLQELLEQAAGRGSPAERGRPGSERPAGGPL